MDSPVPVEGSSQSGSRKRDLSGLSEEEEGSAAKRPHVEKETLDQDRTIQNTIELDPERIVESLLHGKPVVDFRGTTCDVWIAVARKLFARARPDLCQAIWKHVTTTEEDLTYSAAKECMEYFRSTEQWEMAIKVTESIKNVLKKQRDLAFHPRCDRPADEPVIRDSLQPRQCPALRPISQCPPPARHNDAQRVSAASSMQGRQCDSASQHRRDVEMSSSTSGPSVLGEAVDDPDQPASIKRLLLTGGARFPAIPLPFGPPGLDTSTNNQPSSTTVPNASSPSWYNYREDRSSVHPGVARFRKVMLDLKRQSGAYAMAAALNSSRSMETQDSGRIRDKSSKSAGTITEDDAKSRDESIESIEEDAPESSTSAVMRREKPAANGESATPDTVNQDSARVEVVIPPTEADKAERPTTRSMVTSSLQSKQEIIDVKQERSSIAASRALRDSVGRFLPLSPKTPVSGRSLRKSVRAASAAPSPSRSKLKLSQHKSVEADTSGRKAQQSSAQPGQQVPLSEQGLLERLADLISAENERRAQQLERHSSTE